MALGETEGRVVAGGESRSEPLSTITLGGCRLDELERVERPPFAGFEPTDLARGTGSVSKSFIRLGIGLSGDEDGCDVVDELWELWPTLAK